MRSKILSITKLKTVLSLLAFFPLFNASANVVVDGKFTVQEWQGAQVFSSYVQSYPNTGKAPKYPTTTYLLTDDKGIYVAFKNYQPIRSRKYSGHDQYTSADFNMVFIDFNNDGDTAYEFVATLGGGTMDGTYSRGNQSNRDWDGVWQVQVSEQDDYWYSEFFIPWTTATYQVKFGDEREIGVYFQRQNVVDSQAYSFPDTNRGRKNFTYELAPIKVQNIEGQSFRSTVYVVDAYDLVNKNNDININIGVDVTWKPQANQQLIATINPDFGQVESDELIVNYSAVETLRTDKRRFFTENQSLFDVQGPNSLKFVNTRRIGANSELDATKVHDIIAAGKYIYNGSNVNAGILFAQEDDAVGEDGKKFTSARWYSTFDDFSVGQLVNYVENPVSNRTSLVFNQDARYQVDEHVNMSANLLYSNNQTSSEKSIGRGVTLKTSYVPVRHWQNNLEWTYLDDELDINDLGYQQRNNISTTELSSQYDNYKFAANSNILRTRLFGKYRNQRNTEGLHLRDELNLTYLLRMKSKHTFRTGMKYIGRGNDDLITRNIGFVELNDQKDFHLYYQSPTPAKFSFNTTFNYYQEGVDDWSKKIALKTITYFSDSIRFDASYTYIDSDDWLVGNSEGQVKRYSRYLNKVYAKLIARISESSDFTLTTQWYGVKAQGRDVTNSDYTIGNDFNVSNFALQARYRKNLANGSSFYLVYSHNGYDDSDEEDTRFNDLFTNAITNPSQKSITAKLNWVF